MMRLNILLSAGLLVAACQSTEPYDRPTPEGQSYYLRIGTAEGEVLEFYEPTSSICGLRRAGELSDRPSSFLIQNCQVVWIDGNIPVVQEEIQIDENGNIATDM